MLSRALRCCAIPIAIVAAFGLVPYVLPSYRLTGLAIKLLVGWYSCRVGLRCFLGWFNIHLRGAILVGSKTTFGCGSTESLIGTSDRLAVIHTSYFYTSYTSPAIPAVDRPSSSSPSGVERRGERPVPYATRPANRLPRCRTPPPIQAAGSFCGRPTDNRQNPQDSCTTVHWAREL
jgi:hypothetical protein